MDYNWRRKGVAEALLECAENTCFRKEEWNEKCLYLMTDTDNLAALNLYLKNGYLPMQVEFTSNEKDRGQLKIKSMSCSPGKDMNDRKAILHNLASYDRILLKKNRINEL